MLGMTESVIGVGHAIAQHGNDFQKGWHPERQRGISGSSGPGVFRAGKIRSPAGGWRFFAELFASIGV
jgi:hypothetical protein